MNRSEPKTVVVSETRFAHFVRSAPPAERQRVFVKAMKVATAEQKRVVALYKKEETRVAA